MYLHATKTYIKPFIYNNIVYNITSKLFCSILPETSIEIEEKTFKIVKNNIYENYGFVLFINIIRMFDLSVTKTIKEQVLNIISKNS